MRDASAGDLQRREEDVPQGRPRRPPGQARRLGARRPRQARLHRAQRRMGKVPGGRKTVIGRFRGFKGRLIFIFVRKGNGARPETVLL